MKRILYLDKDFMDSYIAQSKGGLPGQRVVSNASGTSENKSLTDPSINQKVSGEGNVSIGIAKGTANYEREVLSEVRASEHRSIEAAAETLTMFTHDNVLDEIIDNSGALDNTNRNVGDFIITGNAKPLIFDVKGITERMDEHLIRGMAQKIWEEHIEKLPNPTAKAVQAGKNAFIDEKIKMLNEACQSLKLTNQLAQFEACIVIDDILAPLNRDWMRLSSREMVFKYNSRLKVFGQITRISDKGEKEPLTNPVEQLYSVFNEAWPGALQRMGIIPATRYLVVDPMAIYFE